MSFDTDSAAAAVFNRQVGDEVLTFTGDGSSQILTDNETSSTWDALSGIALSGPMEGQRLTPIKSTTSFWFGWKDFHPETAVYGLAE